MPAVVQLPPEAKALILQLQRFLQANETVVWATSLIFCLGLLELGQVAKAQACLDKLAVEFAASLDPFVRSKIEELENVLIGIVEGGPPMACTTTHKTSQTVQGPGVCCAALAASGLTPAVGVRVTANNSLGKCIVCEIKASTSPKHPGQLVFKRGKAHVAGSPVACATSSGGCCALVGA